MLAHVGGVAEHPLRGELAGIDDEIAGVLLGGELRRPEEVHVEAGQRHGPVDREVLREREEAKIDLEEAKRVADKVKKGKGFDLEDFKQQIQQMKKMGGVQSLIDKVPSWLNRLAPRAKELFNIDISTAAVLSSLKNLNTHVGDIAKNVAGNVLGFGTAILGAIFQMATIALFTFYFVADGPRMRRAICSALPPKR